MPLRSPTPFREALAQLAARGILPTNMSAAEISAMEAAARRRSFLSARTLIEELLESYKANVEAIIAPRQVTREGRLVTEGLDLATARMETKQLLRGLGYSPDPAKRGTLQDLSSDPRINLVLETNTQLTQGAGHFIQGNDPDVVGSFPCWELVRFEDRKEKRDWPARWRIAAQVAGDANAARVLAETGRMIARKDSGIWQALGDGAGGFTDGLGNPFPPFAFKSGMWVQDVSFEESEALGLVTLSTRVQPRSIDAGEIFEVAT
jgi:hypothetical protein